MSNLGIVLTLALVPKNINFESNILAQVSAFSSNSDPKNFHCLSFNIPVKLTGFVIIMMIN